MGDLETLSVGKAKAVLVRWLELRRQWPTGGRTQIAKLARGGQTAGRWRAGQGRTRGWHGRSAGSRPALARRAVGAGPARAFPPGTRPSPESLVLYEDDEVLVLNKPAGLAVQGGTKTTHHIDRLLSAWGEGLGRPRLTHRLDRDTSGVLVLGKSPTAAARLSGGFARRKAQKTYWAIVEGNPRPVDGVIELALAKTGVGDRELVAPIDPKDPRAQPAITEFVTVSRAGPRAAWLALRPQTGRTHQLRAHMLALGHPILGDPKYNNPRSLEASGPLKLQLHARRLTIPHPSRGLIDVEAPLGPEMKAGFARFGFDPHEADNDPFARPRRR